MPVLENPRHERFAQELAKGKTADEAYVLAGYSANRGNASTLKAKQNVSNRVAEIQAKAADRTVVTIHDIAQQLDDDRDFARQLEAPGPAITATLGKAKVLGLLTDKHEHTGKDGGPIEVNDDRDLARLIVFQLTKASRDTPTVN